MSDSNFYGQSICVIGVFDGVHLGHQYLLEQAEKQADAEGLPLLIVTFDRDPEELLFPDRAPRKLLSNDERLARLALVDGGGARQVKPAPGVANAVKAIYSTDTDRRIVLVLPFERELAGLLPMDFLNHVLAEHCAPRGIHVGADFRFGYQAAGNVQTLLDWASLYGAEVFAHQLLDDGNSAISSTRIRNSLALADLAEANRLLTRPHHLPGTVVHGRGFGRQVGFPTANIAAAEGVMQPADGVYAGFLEIGDELLPAAISVGVPLTFEGAEATIEAYILDYDGDLYDKNSCLYFVEYLRPMIAFASVSELTAQIASDVERCREITARTKEMLD